MSTTQHLGSGLSVSDARDEGIEPRAVRIARNRYQAEISGIRNQTIVRTWVSETIYPTRDEALRAADEAQSSREEASKTGDAA